MKTKLVILLLVIFMMSLQAEVVMGDTEIGTVDSKLPAITIISPAGGEVFTPEDIANISFMILEDSFAVPPEEPVSLQFYFDEVQNTAYDVNMTASDSLYNYDWAVPDQPSENVYTKGIATDFYGNMAEAASGVFEITEPIIIYYGDINDNGEVESYDVSLILMNIVDLDPIPEDPVPWEDWRFQRADVDLDGELYAIDGAYILQYVVGLRDTLPVYDPYRNAENNIVISNDDEYIYFSCDTELFGFGLNIESKENLQLEAVEIMAVDCLCQQNDDKFALVSASGISGDVLRIPYQRSFAAAATISLVLESNGFSENISYRLTEPVPETNKLSALYPNPFNPITTIDYELAESGSVKIEVYNIKGQKIAVLADENKAAGRYSLIWNAEGNNSGIYFIRFSTDTGSEVKKAILLK
ncbi:MAG: T9SS type A sorting domain-containing protein [Candidatus Stygibacter frigidus]|nr:T9SS type A sorting domain-containing protein [Candidatus Stygibacter frigidus]